MFCLMKSHILAVMRHLSNVHLVIQFYTHAQSFLNNQETEEDLNFYLYKFLYWRKTMLDKQGCKIFSEHIQEAVVQGQGLCFVNLLVKCFFILV